MNEDAAGCCTSCWSIQVPGCCTGCCMLYKFQVAVQVAGSVQVAGCLLLFKLLVAVQVVPKSFTDQRTLPQMHGFLLSIKKCFYFEDI